MATAEAIHPLVERALALAPTIASHAREHDVERRLAKPLVDAFVDAGFYRMVVPRALGGDEVSPSVLVDVLERIARSDGSAAWCVMVGATTGLVAALLPEADARPIFHERAVPSGVFAPIGVAVPEGDSLRVRGRWPFASGSEHATVRLAGVVVEGSSETPIVRHVLLDPSDMRIADTWTTAGLRGTGSHDMIAEGVLVPPSRTLSLWDAKPRYDAPVYAFPFFGMLSLGIGAVALGVARAALDAFRELASKKSPAGARRPLAQRETTQLRFAEASASVLAARAFVHDAVRAAEAEAARGGAVSVEARATLRLAAANAVRASASAVDVVYNAAGGSSIYAASPIQRLFQDVHVATQHAMVAEPVWTLAGRVLLGVPADVSQL